MIAFPTFVGIFSETAGEVVSAAYLVIAEKPANPSFSNGKTGTALYVLNYSDFRKKELPHK
ncbi:MAG: hypothetical protein LBU32_11615 [Clostridiales bacterium]|nr:hypothetical protein [Clostridiales bacterium]